MQILTKIHVKTARSEYNTKLMKRILFLFTMTITATLTWSQDYFQQEVNYTISVELDDEKNMLSGFETFEYVNNSPNELSFIYVHLWPNGYRNNETALAKQLYDMNNMVLEYATDEEKGYIDSLDFNVDGKSVKWEYDSEHIDICKLILNQPLKAGDRMKVTTPFQVKIPSGDISRLGHVGESYQITQWYPKPAVYDKEGWHQMPYLTQGEFYSEYGSFDVSITLPENYVVGATGDLQTESEFTFLNERAAQTKKAFDDSEFEKRTFNDEFPESSKTKKTIRYTQKDVHDFAWFADKRYEVLKGEVKLPNSERMVTSWAMFVPENYDIWEDAIEYLNDATFYYSKWNGDYPFNQVTAVDGTISAGGGMEYPNVTVIGNSGTKEMLEVVIVHEVGHNWFYGLLGSNERDHAWMDEGLNTLNEIRYMQTKYPDNTRLSDMARGAAHRVHFHDLNHQDMSDITYRMVAAYGMDQPIELKSADYSSLNYGSIVYAKTGLVFSYLKDYLGDEVFDNAMQKYYDEWHYKHPQPEDLKLILERETAKDLGWIFEDLIQTTKQIDYKIKNVNISEDKSVVTIKNKGQIEGPIRVDAMNFGEVRESKWIEPGETEATFNGTSYDQFIIDANRQIPEVNRNNNYWTKKGLFHRVEPLSFTMLTTYNRGEEWNMYWLPALGYNVYDKFMLGMMFHNVSIPKNKFEYMIAPMYSFGQNTISGLVDMNYTWIPARNIRTIKLGLSGKTFGQGLGYADSDLVPNDNRYFVVQPYLDLMIGKPKEKKNYQQNVLLKGHYILEQNATASTYDSEITGASLSYRLDYKKRVHQFSAAWRLDFLNVADENPLISESSSLMNSGIELDYSFEYWDRKDKSLNLRLFFGQNLFYNGVINDRYGFALGGQSGSMDVMYDHFLYGRNETSGLWSNQRIENQGGFKTTSNFGVTNGSLIAGNFYAQLPFIPLVGVFADYGVFDNAGTMVSAYNMGLGIRISSKFAVYFPLLESDNLKNSYPDGSNYASKIRFTIDLNGLSPQKLIPNALSGF